MPHEHTHTREHTLVRVAVIKTKKANGGGSMNSSDVVRDIIIQIRVRVCVKKGFVWVQIMKRSLCM